MCATTDRTDKRSGERGSLVLLVALLIVVVGGLAVTLSRQSQGGGAVTVEGIRGTEAFFHGDGAVHLALRLLESNNCDATLIPGGSTVSSLTTLPLTLNWGVSGLSPMVVTLCPGGAACYADGSAGQWRVSALPGQGTAARGVVAKASCSAGGGGSAPPVIAGSDLTVGNAAKVEGVKIAACGSGPCNVVNEDGSQGKVTSYTIPNLPTFQTSNGSSGSKTSNVGNLVVGNGQYTNLSVNNNKGMTLQPGGSAFRADKVTVGNAGTLTLQPGTYYIKELKLENASQLVVSPAGEVKLYIGNTFEASNAVDVNTDGAAKDLQTFVYDGGEYKMDNASTVHGVILAPGANTKVTLDNSADLQGAIACGGEVELKNASSIDFTTEARDKMVALGVSTSGGGGSPSITVNAWAEDFS
ncbi:MAG: hypothetical protein HQL56_16865 [Magnetococcales bacterium]|nr:hypothetical protein [Magnetococcales bacterium]